MIDESSEDVILTSSTGSNEEGVFNDDGWEPVGGQDGYFTVEVKSGDQDAPVLMGLVMQVQDASTFLIEVLDKDGNVVERVSGTINLGSLCLFKSLHV